MKKDTDVAAIVSTAGGTPPITIEEYQPGTIPLSTKQRDETETPSVNSNLVLTAYFARDVARVEFLYEFSAGQGSADVETLLKNNGISHRQLFSMFRAGWNASKKFSDNGLDTDYLDYFTWVKVGNEPGHYVLQVTIQAIENDAIKFGFTCKHKDPKQESEFDSYSIEVKKVDEDKLYRVVSAHVENSALARKQLIYRRANHVNLINVPAVPNRREVIEAKSKIDKDVAFADKVNLSIQNDRLFPAAIRFIMEQNTHATDKNTTLKREAIKKIITDSFPDAACRDIKSRLLALLDAKIEANACNVSLIQKILDITEKNKHVLDEKSYVSRHAELSEQLRLEKAKEEKLNKYTQIKSYLESSIFPYMKQGAIAYLLLEHIVDFLYEENEPSDEQSLYKMVDDWMTQYAQDHFMGTIEHDRIATARKQYTLSQTAKDNLANITYGEKLYSQGYVAEIVATVHDLVEVQDTFLAAPAADHSIYFLEDPITAAVSIIVGESGFELKYNRKDFVAALRKQKRQEAEKKITATHTVPANALGDFSNNPDESFRSTMNTLNDGGVLAEALYVPQSASNLFSVLSVEEKISWLVSLWIIECRFYSNDSAWERARKINEFKAKVDKFLLANCPEKNALFKWEHLLETIAFYVAKNTGERFRNIGESEAAGTRLSIEHRKEIIKAIYGDKLPNEQHQKDDAAFTRYVEELAQDVTKLDTLGYDQTEGALGYLKAYYQLARPTGSWIFTDKNRDELVKLTNLLMALNNAAFLDSKGVKHGENATLLTRRECLIELIFHTLVAKSAPYAEIAFSGNEYTALGRTVLNATLGDMNITPIVEYNAANVEAIVSTAFKHVDAVLASSHQDDENYKRNADKRTKRNHRTPPIIEGPNPYAQAIPQVLSLGKVRSEDEDTPFTPHNRTRQGSLGGSSSGSSSSRHDDNGFADRSQYYVAELGKLNAKLKQIEDFLPNENTLKDEIFYDGRLRSLHAQIDALTGPANEYLKNEKNKAAFDAACQEVHQLFDITLAVLPDEVQSLKDERARGFDELIESLNHKIDGIEAALKKSSTDIHVPTFIGNLKAKVADYALNKSNYVDGKCTAAEVEHAIEDLDKFLDKAVEEENEKLQKLKEERRKYRSEDIKVLQDKIRDIKKSFYPESSGSDETSEMLVGKTFGDQIVLEIERDLESVAQNHGFYIAGLCSQDVLDNQIDVLAKKMDAFENGLKAAFQKAENFVNVRPQFDQYLSGSLIQQHKEALNNFTACKATIDNRGFFARMRSFFGFAAETEENQAFEKAKHDVKVLAMMVSVGSAEDVTQDSLNTLDDFDNLNRTLKEVSTERKLLEQKWFPPAKQVSLLLEVERKLEEQISQVTLKQRVIQIRDTNNKTMCNALLNTINATKSVEKKNTWGALLKNVPFINVALEALGGLFSAEAACKAQIQKIEKPSTAVVGLVSNSGNSFIPRTRSASLDFQAPHVPVGEQRNRSASVGAK